MRINAFLALSGLGSRRSVEALIRDGKILINRQIVQDLSFRVDPEKDVVVFRGKRVQPRQHRYILLNKPSGYACTRHDPHAERTIYDLLPRELHGLHHVGRLDNDSEGLLLLCNDGPWTQRILHPSHEIKKIYEVDIKGFPKEDDFARAVRGIQDGRDLLKIESYRSIGKTEKSSSWELVLLQGRKREIRRIFDVLKYRISKLKRVAIGRLRLGELKMGQWRDLKPGEIGFF